MGDRCRRTTGAREADSSVSDPPWGRLFLEALRLDRWAPEFVEERARRGLDLGVAGFILFGGRAEEAARLAGRLRAEADRPLWIAADLERGAGQQFRGASELPPPAALALHEDPEEATRTAARITALEARRIGINWIFAPVLDLDVEPDNPIVGSRSFGADPAVVARLGRIWIESCQAEGVAACAKHFPGHGRTVRDSHMELPAVHATRETLEEDLAPFRAVAKSVAAVMTAHVAFPALGTAGAASLSPALLEGLLRGEIGFEGLVVTDALIMEGFRAGDSIAGRLESAPASRHARALAAGSDLLLYPDDLERAIAEVAAAAAENPSLVDRARDALTRSASTLAGFEPGQVAGGPRFGPPPDRSARVLSLATECIVPAPGWRPDGWVRDRPTAIVALSDDGTAERAPDGETGRALLEELRAAGWNAVPAEAPIARDAAQRLLALRSTPRGWKGRARISDDVARRARAAVGESPRAAVVLLGHARHLRELGLPGICAWSHEETMERAAARWLDARLG